MDVFSSKVLIYKVTTYLKTSLIFFLTKTSVFVAITGYGWQTGNLQRMWIDLTQGSGAWEVQEHLPASASICQHGGRVAQLCHNTVENTMRPDRANTRQFRTLFLQSLRFLRGEHVTCHSHAPLRLVQLQPWLMHALSFSCNWMLNLCP